MKNFCFNICLLCGIIFSLTVQASVSTLAKTLPLSGVPQILRPNDPQSVALGLTGVSCREGLFSTYSNPAGLKFDKFNLAFSHIPGSDSEISMINNQEAFAIGLPVNNKLMLGVHFFNLNFGQVNTYSTNGQSTSKKRAGIRELQISGCKLFFIGQNILSFGSSVKYLENDFPGLEADGFLCDTGLRYRVNHEKTWYAFGLSICNLGEELKHDGFTVDKPLKLLRTGFTYSNNANPGSDLRYLFTIEYQKSLNNDKEIAQWQHLGTGLELQFFKFSFARIGYHFDLADAGKKTQVKGLTYGIGFSTPEKIKIIVPVDISIHYAKGITDHRDFNANVVAIVLGF